MVIHLGVGMGRVNPDALSLEVVSQLREFPCQAMTAFIRGRSRDRKWDKATASLKGAGTGK